MVKSRSERMYENSPKLERDADGKMKVKRTPTGAAKPKADMTDMRSRHLREHQEMAARHVDEHKQLMKKHEDEMLAEQQQQEAATPDTGATNAPAAAQPQAA